MTRRASSLSMDVRRTLTWKRVTPNTFAASPICREADRDSAVETLLNRCCGGRILCKLYIKGLKLAGLRQCSCFSPPRTALQTQSRKSEQTLVWTSSYPKTVSPRGPEQLYCRKSFHIEEWGEAIRRYLLASLRRKHEDRWISTGMAHAILWFPLELQNEDGLQLGMLARFEEELCGRGRCHRKVAWCPRQCSRPDALT